MSIIVAHLRNLVTSLGDLYRSRITAMITILVIAITIALPSGLVLLINNAKQLQTLWEESLQMSIFMSTSISSQFVSQLQHRLENNIIVADVKYLSPQYSLQELAVTLQQPELINNLDDNPLPITLVVTFKSLTKPAVILDLKHELNKLDYILDIDLDAKWLERSFALVNLLKKISFGLIVFLCVAVIFIIGNTIGFVVKGRKKTIAVAKLIGATNSFVLREFLYLGFWYGLLGGVISCVFVNLTIIIINKHITDITKLYGNNFLLHGLNITSIMGLLLLSSMLGVLGAWLFTDRYLRKLNYS